MHLFALTTLLGSASLARAAEITLTEHLQEGGAAVIVTLGLSVLFIAVSIECLLHLRTRAIVPPGLADRAGRPGARALENAGHCHAGARL